MLVIDHQEHGNIAAAIRRNRMIAAALATRLPARDAQPLMFRLRASPGWVVAPARGASGPRIRPLLDAAPAAQA